jgi:hypothetical protein
MGGSTQTLWCVIANEALGGKEHPVTLKARSNLRVQPEFDAARIPGDPFLQVSALTLVILDSRTKASEQQSRGVAHRIEAAAELTLQFARAVIRDCGWEAA